MTKIQKHIEIVRSSEMALSSLSQESCDAIYTLLTQHYAVVGVSTVNNLADLEAVVLKRPDLVFMGVKFIPGITYGSKIWISGYLDQYGIEHTGSAEQAIRLEQAKPLAKQQVLDAGLRTASFLVIKHDEAYQDSDITMEFPLFVKPTNLGGGQGIDEKSVVYNLADLRNKINSLRSDGAIDTLVEQYLPGREFSVAVLKEELSDKLVAMPIELVAGDDAQGNRILSQEVKTSNEEKVLPVTDPRIRARVNGLAVRVFKALGARDYGRIDIRLDSTGAPYFLEANLIPSLTGGYGSFPKACSLNVGLEYEAMILKIVRLGLARQDKPALQAEPSLVS